jgi:hypothetical protein
MNFYYETMMSTISYNGSEKRIPTTVVDGTEVLHKTITNTRGGTNGSVLHVLTS